MLTAIYNYRGSEQSIMQKQLESAMDKYLVKDAPFQIPEGGRQWLVKYVPYLALIGGILSLLGSLSLWRLAHDAAEITNNLNDIARSYGVDTSASRVDYGVLFYVSFAVLIAQGILMLVAYPGLKDRSKKRGWDLLLLSTVASFVYGVIYAFTDTGSFFGIFTSALGALIGLYLLAQVRSFYNGTKVTSTKKPEVTTPKK